MTRLAFMGREHQLDDLDEAKAHITSLKQALDSVDQDTRENVVSLLQDTAGLNLGFAPHVMDAMRKEVGSQTAYEKIVGIIDLLSRSKQITGKGQDVVTVNLNNKYDWSSLTPTTKINLMLSQPDKAGVINADFELTD